MASANDNNPLGIKSVRKLANGHEGNRETEVAERILDLAARELSLDGYRVIVMVTRPIDEQRGIGGFGARIGGFGATGYDGGINDRRMLIDALRHSAAIGRATGVEIGVGVSES